MMNFDFDSHHYQDPLYRWIMMPPRMGPWVLKVMWVHITYIMLA